MTPWLRLRNRLDRLDEHWGAGLAASLDVPRASRAGLLWVPLLVAALVLLLGISPLRQPLGDGLHDLGLRAVARQAHYDEVVVIDIDDASLRALRPRFGAWPYSRDTFALAVGYLRELGARAIVLDIVLSESREGDAALVQALAERRDVVLAAAGLRRSVEPDLPTAAHRERLSLPAQPGESATAWAGLSLPAEPLLAALVGQPGPGLVGVVSTPLDDDGLLRRLPLLHAVDGRIYPSLALAPQLLVGSEAGTALRREGRWLQLGTRRWPVDAGGRVGLALPSNPDAVPSLAFSSLMVAALGLSEGAGLREAVAGRTVFVGSSAFMADEVRTPLGSLSGSVLQATAHAALLRGQVLHQPAMPWALALLGIAWLPSLWLWLRRRPVLVHDAVASLAALIGVVLIGVGALGLAKLQLDMLLPVSAVLFGFVIASGLQLRWVGLANRQLAIERAVADAANQAKSDLLANVSHEIRTPLNALLGVAELLQRTPLNAEQQRYVQVFRSSGQTLFELINDLLDLAKAEAGGLAIVARPFSLRQVLAEVQALMADRATAKGLVLEWQAEAGLPDWVLGDRRRLAQVLTNLVGNAVKFTAEGRVTVGVQATPQGIRFSVVDTGIGIAEQEQQRIFEPFVQADGSATRAHGGTGLGLSIAANLVQRMGGRIVLQSTPGQGSSFSFCSALPPATEPTPQPALPASAARRVEPTDAGPLRVLLTEDNEVNALLIAAMLEGTDVQLDRASHGEAAVECWHHGHYDLVLMDVQMPGMDGHAATREIRRIEQREGRPPTPIYALTAHAFTEDAERSRLAGCTGHLTKPVSRETLLATVQACRPRLQPPTA
jgi:signal transduction histidine kinase